MKKKKLLYAILCALGGGIIGFFANQLTEWYGCVLFGLGVALMVYSIILFEVFSISPKSI